MGPHKCHKYDSENLQELHIGSSLVNAGQSGARC